MMNSLGTNLAIRKAVLIVGLFMAAIVVLCVGQVGSVAGKPTMSFTVDRRSVHRGESTTLSWEVLGASQAFLSYIGTVRRTGSVIVRPEHTTTYTLLADTSSGLITRSVTVEVAGSGRGDEFPLNTEDFKYPLTSTTKWGFANLAIIVHSVLQDEMHLSVKKVEYDPDHEQLVFITSRARDQRVLKPSESRIGERRVAYLVTIQPGIQDGTLDYMVKTLAEYRLRVEETWRTEQSDDVYTSSGGNVRSRIDNRLKGAELMR
jgi:hypothetical protein